MKETLSALLTAFLFLNIAAPSIFAKNVRTVALPMQSIMAGSTDITPPAGSGTFGTKVLILSNGNLAITDPGFDQGATLNVGAVYLYGPTGTMISQLTGTTASDAVGGGGIVELSNGNFVALSPSWDDGATSNVGAVTWINGATGLNGTVSSANSLVGSSANDAVGSQGVTALTNGNYVVASAYWRNGAVASTGAVTWCDGATGRVGVVSSTNSLVGSTASDNVGLTGVVALANGNYVVRSNNWDNGATLNVGAVTWGNGTSGVTGTVSSSNSLIGSTANDTVGSTGVTALANGNYVVRSNVWDNGAATNAGAVTWGSGTSGVSGAVSSANSLVGSTSSDNVGGAAVVELTNGNYVLTATSWDNGATANVGAVTWANGTTGIVGTISASNSLIGSILNDNIGSAGVVALTNGNYVVASQNWDNGATANVGAVTWCNGTTGTFGAVSTSNSLYGSTASDAVGGSPGVKALTNGNYVVSTTAWDNGAVVNAGAATWGNGTTGTTGPVTSSNSLVGSTVSDSVGTFVTALTNGNYVVGTPNWDNGAVTNAGAATWGDGTTGISGPVSSSNSLVGSTANDYVGSASAIVALTNGNYVVASNQWDSGATTNVGAVTWANGATGITGPVTSSNSLTGSTSGDAVGIVLALTNGNYVVCSSFWDNGATADVGAVTWGDGTTGITGPVTTSNSLVGGGAYDGVGDTGISTLPNGNYVVISSAWSGGNYYGAWTQGNGTAATVGVVSSANSNVGANVFDAYSYVLVKGANSKWLTTYGGANRVSLPALAAPTAASAKIEGKAVTSDQRAIRGVKVTVTDTATGVSKMITTNNFGRFVFEGLEAGGTYIVSIENTRRYRFAENVRSLPLYEDIQEMIFTATP